MAERNDRYRVIVSKRATQMLVSHAAFLAEVSREAAESLVTAFEEGARSLETMPRRCPWLTGEFIPGHTYRSLMIQKRYLLIYQIRDDIVYVDYVVDCRQDYGWLIRE